jgi:predicted nucleotidyltransferase
LLLVIARTFFMLESLITSKTRLRLLIKFFVNSQNHSHLRGLAEEFGESTNAIRKELNNLTHAGILIKHSDKNKIEYQANTGHPFYTNIRDIIRKYLGLDMLLEQILERMGGVDQVILIGDIARGSDTGTIDVLVTGDSLNEDYFNHLTKRLEQLIDRKVIFNLAATRSATDGLVLFDRQAGV